MVHETPLSVSHARWHVVPSPPHIVEGLVEATNMPRPLAEMLAGRGITKDGIEAWLTPRLRDLMPDPLTLADMDKAVGRLADAVESGEKIGIFGDYDVDGAASAAILYDVLGGLGLEVSVHIPHRFTEGYGPNEAALLGLVESGCRLILTVDCGITAHAPIAATIKAGVETIIIEHHIPGTDLPPAYAVVNPQRLDDESGVEYLAAAGVVFLVAVGLVRELRERGYFNDTRMEPDLMRELDIVALATVADIMPLKGLNRAFVRSGLKVMARRQRLGLAALADLARLNAPPDSYALGFVLGPRINAGGRLGDSVLGVQLLTASDAKTAEECATQLDVLNAERRNIESETTEIAMKHAEKMADDKVLCLADAGCHEGVIGISAGRVKDALNKTACVISVSADGRIGKGSARAVKGFRLGSAIIAARQAGLLLAGGGHDAAAGFSLDMQKLDDFRAFLNARADKELGADAAIKDYYIDAEMPLTHIGENLLDWLDRTGPYGVGMPTPLFLFRDVALRNYRAMGKAEEHIGMRLDDGLAQVDAVAFGVAGTAVGGALAVMRDGARGDIIGTINRNRFRGESKPQIIIRDIRMG